MNLKKTIENYIFPSTPFGRLVFAILKKMFVLGLTFLGITLISFFVIHLAPGSPTDMETTLNPMADAEAQKRLMALYKLDQPIYKQYWDWLGRLAHLDFGQSMSKDNRNVIDIIAERLPFTLWLNVASLFITLAIAIPIGIYSAYKKNGIFDKITTAIIFIGFAMPSFWLALLLMVFFSMDLQWFPISGISSLGYENFSLWEKILDRIHHLALPMFVITFGSLAGLSRYMRSSMIDVLQHDFILTARAKGLSERCVVLKHALRNALLPLITILGLSIPGLIGGSVIIESIFSLPGMGQLFYKAVMARNYSLIMGNLVISAFLTLLGTTLADICYHFADPRIRTSLPQYKRGKK